jgi:serine/threonine-protein kinase
MPPEQTRAGAQIDQRADLYALGMAFFEAITKGRHPLEDLFDQHPREALKAQRERFMPPPSTYLPADFPVERAESVDAWFQVATAKSPNERFQSATAMRRALEYIE